MNIGKTSLKRKVKKVLNVQGYGFKNNLLYFNGKDRDSKRQLHCLSRAERLKENIDFIKSFLPKAKQYLRDSSSIDIMKIKPRLIEVQGQSEMAGLFRWWNLVWWSLPYEKTYGRLMRFIVWDDYHDAPVGLIGLQSPILSWNVRDKYLGITAEQRDYWVNQSLSAQRLGALPPYNNFLGGKLVASLMTSNIVRNSFKRKYKSKKTLILNRILPANLLFITTTGAYGKSSVYNRLKFHDDKICDFIGYTSGYGSFHIPNTLYEAFIEYLRAEGYKGERAFGNGPSLKMKNINKTMQLLGFKDGCSHGIKRAVYLFPLIKNLKSVVQNRRRPVGYNRKVEDLTNYWLKRWAYKRADDTEKNNFMKKNYLEELEKDWVNCERLINKNIGL